MCTGCSYGRIALICICCSTCNCQRSATRDCTIRRITVTCNTCCINCTICNRKTLRVPNSPQVSCSRYIDGRAICLEYYRCCCISIFLRSCPAAKLFARRSNITKSSNSSQWGICACGNFLGLFCISFDSSTIQFECDNHFSSQRNTGSGECLIASSTIVACARVSRSYRNPIGSCTRVGESICFCRSNCITRIKNT